jgi:hypothetical protein
LFNKKELDNYEINNLLDLFLKLDDNKDFKKLIFPLIKIENIPLEIKAKFIFKIVISYPHIFEAINNSYKISVNSKFAEFIRLMYEGINKKVLESNFSNNLYKLYFINKNEYNLLEEQYSSYLENNNFDLPFGFIFFRHFIDFEKDKNKVLNLEKIYNNYIFEPEYSFVLLEILKNDNFTYYTHNLDSKGFTDTQNENEKIFFFPFTPLIIKKISYENLGEFKIKKLILNYIDLYDEKINLFSFNENYLNNFTNYEYSKQIIANPYLKEIYHSIDDFKNNIKIFFNMIKKNDVPPPAMN